MDFTPFIQRDFLKWLISGAVFIMMIIYFLTSSVFIKPLYRAEAVVYVPLTLFNQQYEQGGIGFGSDPEINAHIQIMLSNSMFDSLIERFDLAKLWKINTASDGAKANLYARLNSHLDVSKNRYNSVSVRVSHPDAATSAHMANTMVTLADVLKEEMLRENRHAAYRFAKERYDEKLMEINRMENSPEEWTEVQFKTVAGISMGNVRQRNLYEAELWELTSLKNQYQKLHKSILTPQPRSYVVSAAIPPAKPIWPPRLIITGAAMMIFVLLMIFVQLVKQEVKNAKAD
jgi:uncharacterized protein involved in exopolysaccharide biosynthesis